jgi:hypothetical protein
MAFQVGYCNPYKSCHILPLNFLCNFSCTNVTLIIANKHRMKAFIFSLLLTAFTIGFCLIRVGHDLVQMLIGITFQLIIFYDIRKKDYKKFLMTVKLKEAIEENKRLEAAEKANDLRAMIGNVAHDLKQ